MKNSVLCIILLSLAFISMAFARAVYEDENGNVLEVEEKRHAKPHPKTSSYVSPKCKHVIDKVEMKCSDYHGRSWFQLPQHLNGQCCKALDMLKEKCYEAIKHSWGRMELFESLHSTLCSVPKKPNHHHQHKHHHHHHQLELALESITRNTRT